MIKFESEAALEQCFVDYYKETGLDPSNNEEWESLYQQPEFGSYGRGDLLYRTADIQNVDGGVPEFIERVHIIELKNEPLKLCHLSQTARYYQYLRDETDADEVTASIIVPSFDISGDTVFLIQQIDWLSVFVFSMSMSGITFKCISNYSPSNKNWPESISDIDSADYMEATK